MEPVELVVYSDYLCPWCYNASVRLERLQAEFGEALRLSWRAYLLRREPRFDRDPVRFQAYTRSWERPAAEPDAGEFRAWQGKDSPPSHSLPAQCVARAAARLSRDAFRQVHGRLLQAYFSENRDISDTATLESLWLELGLEPEAFGLSHDAELQREIRMEDAAARERGVTGVPAVRVRGDDAIIVGAQPLELYQRWVERLLERRTAPED
ncbi:DsbA family protein [Myxococcota bacterium]|nr:DsbA family protein [Myxococcota bacterium]